MSDAGGPSEAFVQVAPSGGGQDIRNLQLTVLQDDGSLVKVMMQVIAIADEKGRMLSFGTMEQTLDNIFLEMVEIRRLIERVVS